jgi:hypothetical protein
LLPPTTTGISIIILDPSELRCRRIASGAGIATGHRRVPQRAEVTKRSGNFQGAWTAREDCPSRCHTAIPAFKHTFHLQFLTDQGQLFILYRPRNRSMVCRSLLRCGWRIISAGRISPCDRCRTPSQPRADCALGKAAGGSPASCHRPSRRE